MNNNSTVPILLTNSSNKLIITSSSLPNKTSNIKFIQNANTTVSNTPPAILPSGSNTANHEYYRKYNRELFVKLRSFDCDKRIDILQFTNDGSLDQNLSVREMFMQRDRSQKIKTIEPQAFGAGTEFGKEAKEEAKIRKYSLNKKKLEQVDPINLCIGRGKNLKKYKAAKESMFENSQYCVFIRSSSDCFEAVPVKEWYRMHLEVASRYSKLDDPLEEMNKIEKTFESTSSLYTKRYKSEMDNSLGVGGVGSGKLLKTSRKPFDGDDDERYSIGSNNLIVTNNDKLHDSDSSVDEEREVLRKRKNAEVLKKLRLGKERDREESDEDDWQGDEVDYMTHSSSDEDALPEEEREKIYNVVNVDEEVVNQSDEELSNLDENTSNTNAPDEQDKKINSSNINKDDESGAETDSSNGSSLVSSLDESDESAENGISLKQRLSNTIHRNIAVQHQMKSKIIQPPDRSRYDNAQCNRIVQEMYKYLSRKPISKQSLFKKLTSKKLLASDSQKTFDSLLEQINVVTNVVNGEKLYSIVT